MQDCSARIVANTPRSMYRESAIGRKCTAPGRHAEDGNQLERAQKGAAYLLVQGDAGNRTEVPWRTPLLGERGCVERKTKIESVSAI